MTSFKYGIVLEILSGLQCVIPGIFETYEQFLSHTGMPLLAISSTSILSQCEDSRTRNGACSGVVNTQYASITKATKNKASTFKRKNLSWQYCLIKLSAMIAMLGMPPKIVLFELQRLTRTSSPEKRYGICVVVVVFGLTKRRRREEIKIIKIIIIIILILKLSIIIFIIR